MNGGIPASLQKMNHNSLSGIYISMRRSDVINLNNGISGVLPWGRKRGFHHRPLSILSLRLAWLFASFSGTTTRLQKPQAAE
jgi:hypothetical protein